MRESQTPRNFQPKKLPKQARSRATFDAAVEACARLLVERGYVALTTNHIADTAGISIGSLYEYFEDKDAVVYEVVRRNVEAFSEQAARPISELPPDVAVDVAVRTWIGTLLLAMQSRQALLRAIVAEVPLALREPHLREAWERHLAITRTAYQMAGPRVRQERASEVSFLIVTFVDAALTRLVLEPPADLSVDTVVDELVCRIVDWLSPAP